MVSCLGLDVDGALRERAWLGIDGWDWGGRGWGEGGKGRDRMWTNI